MNIKIGGIAQMDVHSPKKHVTIGFDPSPDGFTKKKHKYTLAYHN